MHDDHDVDAGQTSAGQGSAPDRVRRRRRKRSNSGAPNRAATALAPLVDEQPEQHRGARPAKGPKQRGTGKKWAEIARQMRRLYEIELEMLQHADQAPGPVSVGSFEHVAMRRCKPHLDTLSQLTVLGLLDHPSRTNKDGSTVVQYQLLVLTPRGREILREYEDGLIDCQPDRVVAAF